ncbi:MAG: YtxH domain-containing protein [Acidobacteriota bacterium]|nr:YtxH domain-containing protein [Acidobacteriota bacterium]
MPNCNIATKVSYFVAGMGIGAAIALLFAPQSGEETRKQIAEKAQDGKDYVTAKGRDIRKQAEDLVDQGKDLVSKQKARLADVLESGKQAARETFAR